MRTFYALVCIGLLLLSMNAALPSSWGRVTEGSGAGLPTHPTGGSSGDGFLENLGQFDDAGVRYYAHWAGGGIAFLDGAVAMMVTQGHGADGLEPSLVGIPSGRAWELPSAFGCDAKGCTVLLSFENAAHVRPEARLQLPGERNFLIGSDPAGWRTGVHAFGEVVYRGLYDGIDLVYKSTASGLKYDFILAPGADPAAIRVRCIGQSEVLLRSGSLVLRTPYGDIVDSPPVSHYQDDARAAVRSHFRLLDGSRYGFAVSGRDMARGIVIDPIVYSSFLGGEGDDSPYAIILDSNGTILVGGMTTSADFPTTPGVFQGSMKGAFDSFISRFSSDGRTLMMSTYLGGSDFSNLGVLHTDPSGAIYTCGAVTSDGFPTTSNAPQPRYGGGFSDGIACKLDGTGKDLLYSTYYGGSGEDYLNLMDVDASGCMYCAGYSTSDDLNITPGAFQESHSGIGGDGIVVKFNPNGDSFNYSTYLGGIDEDMTVGMAVDSAGCAYVTGFTRSADFPTTPGAYSTSPPGAQDGFVTKLSKDGSSLVYSTLIGGSSEDRTCFIMIDPDGRAIFTGSTGSTDFPVSGDAYQKMYGGGDLDNAVSRLSADGSSLEASTFIGGNGLDAGGFIDMDGAGRIYIGAYTNSTDYPTTEDAISSSSLGGWDVVFSVLDHNLTSLEYSTYIGSPGDDFGAAVCVSEPGYAWILGDTSSGEFPVTEDAYQKSFSGVPRDCFFMELGFDSTPPRAEAGPDQAIDQHQSAAFDGSLSTDDYGIANYTWNLSYNGSNVTLYGPSSGFTFDEAGLYTVTLTVIDYSGLYSTDTVNVTVRDITAPMAEAGPDILLDQHENANFNGTLSTDNVGIVGYEWTFAYRGGNESLAGPLAIFLFDDAGAFEVMLNVSDAAGNWAIDRMVVHVADITAPVADAGPDIRISQHESATLNGTGSTDNVGVVNWTWTLENGGTSATIYGPTPMFVFDDAGRFNITLRVSDAEGNIASDNLTMEVLDTTPPTASAGPDTSILQGQTMRFDGRGSGDNVAVVTWAWTFDYGGAAKRLDSPTPTFTFDLAGTYVVTLSVTDIAGNTAKDTVTVTVTDTEPPVASAGDEIRIAQHQIATLDGSLSTDNIGVANWTWTIGYGGSDVMLYGPRPTHRFDNAGRFLVKLTVADAAGNRASGWTNVTVRDTTPPVASAGPDMSIDQGASLALNGSGSTDNVGVVSWTWTFAYNGTPVRLLGRSQTYTFDRPGVVYINLTVADAAGNGNSTQLKVTVRDSVKPVVVMTSHITATRGRKVVLDGSGASDNVGIVRWAWTFRDGGKNVTLEGMKVSHAFADKGDHAVTLTAFDAEGNSATGSLTVTVGGASMVLWGLVAVVLVVAVTLGAILGMRRRAAGKGSG